MTPEKFNMSHCCKLAVDGLVRPAFMWLSIPVFTGDIAANGKVVEVESTADTVEVAAGREVTAVGRVVVMEVGCNGEGGVMCSSFMASR